MLWIVQNGLSSKLPHAVEYPQFLDLQGLHGDNGAVQYELEGVLLHEGSSREEGHYYGLHMTSAGVWQCINDADISESCLESALSYKEEIYMACYRKLSNLPQADAQTAASATAHVSPKFEAILRRQAPLSELSDQVLSQSMLYSCLPGPQPVAAELLPVQGGDQAVQSDSKAVLHDPE